MSEQRSASILANPKEMQELTDALNTVYKKIPDTTGCLSHITEPVETGGCGAWCCQSQNPMVLYSEFLNTWRNFNDHGDKEQVTQIIAAAIRNFLSNKFIKGCIFFDKDSKLCKQHETRPFNCLHPDTWVFTAKGPKRISEIMAGEEVYGEDGRLHLVLATSSQINNSGVLYSIKPQGSNIGQWATGQHQWLVSRQKDKRKTPNPSYVKSSELLSKKGNKTGDYLVFPKNMNWANRSSLEKLQVDIFISGERVKDRLLPFTSGKLFDGKEMQSIPLEIKVNDEFLFMLGIYLAEGYSSESSSSFCMNVNEKHHLNRVISWLESYDIKWHINTKKNNLVLRVDSCLFGRLMKKLCGSLSENKAISTELFGMLDREQLYKIFESWHIGDGRKTYQGSVAFSGVTVSEKLAVQMQQILLQKNIYPRIRIEHRDERGRESYCVLVNASSLDGWAPVEGHGSKIMYDEDNLYAPLSRIVTKTYEGAVFDLQVENSESFVTASGVVHNCRIYGITPEEEFKPRYERLKVLYPNENIRDQCNLVSTVDGTKVTKEMTNQWWKELKKVEVSLGVPESMITDARKGTYRTYHDHIMLMLYPLEILKQLTEMRLHAKEEEKEAFVQTVIEQLRKKEAAKSGNTNS